MHFFEKIDPGNHTSQFLIKKLILLKGASKNYVTPRGGKGVDDFVKNRYVSFEGGGGIFRDSYVTADT